MSAINLRTALPGPKSQAILDRRDAAVSKASFRSTPVVAAKASGATVTDVDGNTFRLHGRDRHGQYRPRRPRSPTPSASRRRIHPPVCDRRHLRAVHRAGGEAQLARAHCRADQDLPEQLGRRGGGDAIKMARAYTGRPAIVTYEGVDHGRTLLTLSLTSNALFKRFRSFAPEIYRVPYRTAIAARTAATSRLTRFGTWSVRSSRRSIHRRWRR